MTMDGDKRLWLSAKVAFDTWWPAAFGAAVLFCVSILGWIFSLEISGAVLNWTAGHLDVISDPATIYTIWVGALGVHAAVGALAPILGYTLLATNMTTASRIAPAGGVAALEIKWARYLRVSLTLLVTSMLGVMLAPSATGLACAVIATCFVVFKTMRVFRQGFDLIERPERYDEGARKYLLNAVSAINLEDRDTRVLAHLGSLNGDLARSTERLPNGHYPLATLRVGSQFADTELVRYHPGSLSNLVSEASALGYQLYAMRESLPRRLEKGQINFLAIVRSARADQFEQADAVHSDDHVNSSAVHRMQKILDACVLYRTTQNVDDLARIPLLLRRHVATVIYEALPNQRPHDAEYGLDILGVLVDEITARLKTGRDVESVSSEKFRWIYEVPTFLLNQLGDASHSREIYSGLLTRFLRGRLIVWLAEERFDGLSRAYIELLIRIVKLGLLRGAAAEYELAVIRDIPLMLKCRRDVAVALLGRELAVCFVDQAFRKKKFDRSRASIIRAMTEMLAFGDKPDINVLVEVRVSLLSLALFKADRAPLYKKHVSEAIVGIAGEPSEDLLLDAAMSAIGARLEIVDKWRWDWWELDQRGRGATWMTMGNWIVRAIAVLISQEGWQLPHLEDSRVPPEYVLSTLLREIGSDTAWLALLPEATGKAVERMSGPLQELLTRRKEIVAKRVADAEFSPEKARAYVQEQVQYLVDSFVPHNDWLRKAAAVRVGGESTNLRQSGVRRLIPKEALVADGVADTSVVMVSNNVGAAAADFELATIATALIQARQLNLSDVSAEPAIWQDVARLVDGDARYILIIGVGVGRYEMHKEIDAATDKAKSAGKEVRFESIREIEGLARGIIVADAKSFFVRRSNPQASDAAIYRQELGLDQGGIVSEISEIDPDTKHRWVASLEEERRRDASAQYDTSVVASTYWSFEVVLTGQGSYSVHSLPPRSEALAG
jgi:hypothetical protein